MRTPSTHGAELITHPDVNLVLRRTNFASLPQVRDALRAPANAPDDAATIGRDQDGTKVLSAFQTIEPLGWRVFVEEPLSEAFAPLKSAIWRTALLLVAFLLLAIATSVLLARRLVRPIESIQAAAARIGSGALDQRIEIPSNDELGASPRSSTAWPLGSTSRTRASSTRSRSGRGSSRRR